MLWKEIYELVTFQKIYASNNNDNKNYNNNNNKIFIKDSLLKNNK